MKTVFRFENGLYKKISVEDQLKARISKLNRDIENLAFDLQHSENNNTALNEKNANLSFKFHELEKMNQSLNDTIEDLQNELDDLRNR